MFSSLETVVSWVADTFDIPASTYPQAWTGVPFAVVNRVGGTCDYPHDYPRFAVQLWMPSDADGETAAFACAIATSTIQAESSRINAVGAPEITQLGHVDSGAFVWQVSFDLATNIYNMTS